MGYILALGAVLMSGVKGFFGKKLSRSTNSSYTAALVSTVRMAFCSLIGVNLIALSGDYVQFSINAKELPIFALSGLSTALFIIFWLLSVRDETLVLLEAFTSAGVIVPIALCFLFLKETVKITELLGVTIIIAAVIIMTLPAKENRVKISKKSFITLTAAGIACGMCDFSQKLYIAKTPQYKITGFNLYTYLFALFILLVYLLISKARNTAKQGKINAKEIGFIIIIALTTFIYSYFKTKAAVFLSASILYPLYQGSWLILAVLISAILFKEKLTLKNIIGISLTFIALLIINLL